MAKKRVPELGPLEFKLLRILWKHLSLTAPQVLAQYNKQAETPLAYTTVMTLLGRMADKQVLSDGQREVVLYVIENPHATASLIGYVPDARLGFVTDLWTPGPPLGATLNPGQAAVVAAVKKAGISPLKFAGGHGSTAEYASLAALDGK